MGLFKKTDSSSWLIVGLGNPGEEYRDTRHNAGFLVIKSLAQALGVSYWKSECGAHTALAEIDDKHIILAMPQSYMNLSGGPVSQLMKHYNVSADHVIVVHDELDLPEGTIKVKFGGGHAGHNGLKSIAEKTASKDWYRVRIGIGRPPGKQAVSDYVLRVPKGESEELFQHALALGEQAAISLVKQGLTRTQDSFN